MVELLALVRHRQRVDDLAEGRRSGLHVDGCERIGLREVWAEQQSISEVLGRRFDRKLRRAWKVGSGLIIMKCLPVPFQGA
jgi:hypothetical protein